MVVALRAAACKQAGLQRHPPPAQDPIHSTPRWPATQPRTLSTLCPRRRSWSTRARACT